MVLSKFKLIIITIISIFFKNCCFLFTESLERAEPKNNNHPEILESEKEGEKKELQEIKAQLERLEQHQEELRHEEITLQVNESGNSFAD